MIESIQTILQSSENLGIRSIIGLVVLLILVWFANHLKTQSETKKDLENAEEEYRKAVDSRDLDRIRVAMRRLSALQEKAK